MADDAFALSPISARASMPTEADYEAICSAFMETARGRWFLGEYGKRNRNADTRMVLDAVERIEATLASQKASTSPSLVELLPAIASLIADAQQQILDTLPETDIRPATEPIQRTAGILRDVAWTLRESGADTRVCDLLDVQAKAIVDGCTRMHGDLTSGPDIRATVATALDALTRQITGLARADVPLATPQQRAPAYPEPAAEAPYEEAPPALSQAGPAATATLDVVAPDQRAAAKQQVAEATGLAASEAREAVPEPLAEPQASMAMTMVEVDVQANLWEDLEITDIDPDDAVAGPAEAADRAGTESTPVAVEAKPTGPIPVAAEQPESEPAPIVADAPRDRPATAAQEPPATAAAELPPKPPPSSLGQAALDGGAVIAAAGRYSEALAPIRRMSQAEKVAFFS